MKDWKDIIYEEEVKSGNISADYVASYLNTESFHIDDKTIDKVPRIPINFNT